MKTRTLIILVIIFSILLVFMLSLRDALRVAYPKAAPADAPIATAVYTCDSGKSITASYFAGPSVAPAAPGMPPTPTGTVRLELSDGREMTLPRTLSADGARYATTDESFVFWNRGDGALVLENGAEADYTNCIAPSAQ